MPDEPESARTPKAILYDLADVFSRWLDYLGTTAQELPPEIAAIAMAGATACILNRVPPLLRELGIVVGYDFDTWIKDLEEKGTPEAKELAEKVLLAFDKLEGAF